MSLSAHAHHESLDPPQAPPDWSELAPRFRGSALQNYFRRLHEDALRAVMKPQYVDQIQKLHTEVRVGTSNFCLESRRVWIDA